MNVEIFAIILTFFISLLIIIFKRSFVYFLVSIEIAFNSLLLLFVIFLNENSLNVSPFFLYILGIIAAETAIGLAILLNLVKVKGNDKYDL